MTTEPTVAGEGAMNIESIKELMDAFDPAALLPELDSVFGKVLLACRVAVMVGPLLLLALGLVYLFLTPREANHYVGYRCYFGMGSVQAWRFTQRLAGIGFAALGLILSIVTFLASAGFPELAMESLVFRSARLLLIQAGLALLLNIGITLTTAIVFDRKGEYRGRKK